MVKRLAGAVTLGIGDGANDVGMIRAAHIGAATVSACSPGAWQAIAMADPSSRRAFLTMPVCLCDERQHRCGHQRA